MAQIFEKAPSQAEDVIDNAAILTNYVNTVINHVLRTKQFQAYLATDRIDRDEYLQRTQELNKQRNEAHDKACEACDAINQIAVRAKIKKVFDFELEPMKDERGYFKGYSQNNHHKVSLFCAQFVNEFYQHGTIQYNKMILDQVTEQNKQYPIKDLKKLPETSKEFAESLNEINIKELLNNGQTEFRFKDGISFVGKGNSTEFSEVKFYGCVSNNIEEIAMENSFYFEKDGRGYDIPISVMEEIALKHGGLLSIDQEHTQESFEDKLNRLEKETQKFSDIVTRNLSDIER